MHAVRPLSLMQSVLFFGGSAIVFRVFVYAVLPLLQERGVPPFWAFILSYSTPLTFMLVATYLGIRAEGNGPFWRVRLRLRKLTGRQVGLCVALFALSFLLTGLLLPTAKYLASIRLLAPPAFLPAILNPNQAVPGNGLTEFLGVPLRGAYWILPVYFVFLTLFNILGEELWFRGYLLPRQELTWGSSAWVYHGVFWCLFHTPIYPWTILYLLPTTLAVSYAAQKFNSTWAGFIIHYAGNGLLALVPIGLGIFR